MHSPHAYFEILGNWFSALGSTWFLSPPWSASARLHLDLLPLQRHHHKVFKVLKVILRHLRHLKLLLYFTVDSVTRRGRCKVYQLREAGPRSRLRSSEVGIINNGCDQVIPIFALNTKNHSIFRVTNVRKTLQDKGYRLCSGLIHWKVAWESQLELRRLHLLVKSGIEKSSWGREAKL